jgi:P4 family phage/plasmid primase-like protien
MSGAKSMKTGDTRQVISDPDKIADGLLVARFIWDPPAIQGDSVLGERHRDQAAETLRYWRGDFYHWTNGCWHQMADYEIDRIITRHIQDLNGDANAQETICVSTNRVRNVRQCLIGRVGLPQTRDMNTWEDGRERLGIHSLSMGNGVLTYSPHQLDPGPVLARHSPRFFCTIRLPYDYNPEAGCPKWQAFLEDVLSADKEYITLIQQWVGYVLRPDLREQKFLLCVGEGANGKGVLFEVIQDLVGQTNCSQVPLSRFGNPFALYSTFGKLVNMSSESTHMIDEEAESILKSFVAGDRFTFERKFREPVDSLPTAKLMIATNALPRFNDKTQGVWRRILLVPFDKMVPEDRQIKGLGQEIAKEELPGIFNWGMDGLRSLNRNNGFVKPARTDDLLEEYRRDSDPSRAFLADSFTQSPNAAGISCSEVYKLYRQWCEDNGCHPLGQLQFGRHVRRIFPGVDRVRLGGRDNREWVYRGLVSQVAQQLSI